LQTDAEVKSVQGLSFFDRLIYDVPCLSGSENFADDIVGVLFERRA